MITKGIVEELLNNKVRVRLPIYDGISGSSNSTKKNDLSLATICSLPNTTTLLNVGDIVWVGFEDNDNNKPVVLGHLYNSKSDTYASLNLGMLVTNSTTHLNKDTSIGKVKANEIEALSGTKYNIQSQINELNDISKELDNKTSELSENFQNTLDTSINDIEQNLNELNILIKKVANSGSKIFIQINSTQNINFSMLPKIYYQFINSNITKIELTLTPPVKEEDQTDDEVGQYLFEFVINSTAPSIIYKNPDGSTANITYANGWLNSDFEPGYKYIVYILNNIAYVSYIKL